MAMISSEDIYHAIENENLTIEVTTRCTNTCTHCFVRAGRNSFHDMEPAFARKVLADGRDAGFRHLHITGGEPLLWHHLFPFIEQALSMGYESVFLNTNGSFINDKKARRFAEYGKLTISVSLQGPEHIHDAMRGAGSYVSAVCGLRAALDAGIPCSIFTVVSKSLLWELPRFADNVFRDFPEVQEITLIQLIRVPGDAFDLTTEILLPEDFLVMVRMAAMLRLYGVPVSFLENPLASAAAQSAGLRWLPQTPSLYRPGRLVVMAEGSITLAHSAREGLGIFVPGAIKKILRSEAYLHAVSPDETICRSCEHVGKCRENGMMRPSEPFRDHEEKVPFCKRVMDLVGTL